MDKENFTIERFSNAYIGDDAAVAGKMVFSKDIFAQNSHFKLGWLSLEEIGYKAMIVNFSDCIVMNARPKFALLGLSLPRNFTHAQITGLTRGIKKACDEFGVQVIGGDTIGSDVLNLSVSIVGELAGKAVRRSGAKKGDIVAHTGWLGGSLKGLRALQNGGQLGANSRFVKPVLRERFFYAAAKFINAAMDVSDGLGTDLAKFCAANECGVKFSQKLSQMQLKSGEEYEMLFTFSPRHAARVKNEAKKARVRLNLIGKITKGRYKNHARNHHF